MFESFTFTNQQVKDYYKAALRDLEIANMSDMSEVMFRFSYDALLKLAIAVSAKNGLRVKSRMGHHTELIVKLSEFFNNEEIRVIGNKMRQKRNIALYAGGYDITEKEAKEYLKWINTVFHEAKSFI